MVKYSRGVRSVVSFGDSPAPVDDMLIETIKTRIKGGYVVLDPPTFEKGEEVRVKEGPLEGIRGIFDRRIKDSDRVIILLNTISSQSRLIIPATLLHKAS